MINEDTSNGIPDLRDYTVDSDMEGRGLGPCDKCGERATEVVRIETFRGSTIFTVCTSCLGGLRETVWAYLKGKV